MTIEKTEARHWRFLIYLWQEYERRCKNLENASYMFPSKSSFTTVVEMSTYKSPGKGVQYFGHFPKNVLRPYGPADEAPSDDKIFSRITSFNCEWLLRLDVALSEFASTVKNDVEILKQSNDVVRASEIDRVARTIEPFLSSLQLFDSKSDNSRKPTLRDLTTVAEGLLGENDSCDKFFKDAVLVGGTLFSLGIHYSIARELLNNPQKFPVLSRHVDGKDSSFKKEPTLREMMQYLQATCIKDGAMASPAKRNLLNELQELSGEDPGHAEPEASTYEEDRQEVSPRKKKKKAAKRPCLEDTT